MQRELENVSYLSRKHYKKILQLTAPLNEKFGITYFARQTITADGHWEIFGNLPDWLEYSATNKYYEIDPSLLPPTLYDKGLNVNSSHNVPLSLRQMAHDARSLYNIENTLCIYDRTATKGHWYFFGTHPDNHHILNTYITRIGDIYKYIKYFQNTAQDIIYQNQDYQINVSKLKEFHGSNAEVMPLANVYFDEDTIIELKTSAITAREKDCIKYLLQGKTIKETAKGLKLSPRTVEEYLQRLKQKLGCKYKRDLMQYFLQSGFITDSNS